MNQRSCCPECDRLREAYANAVFECVRLDSKMKMAKLSDDVGAANLVNSVEAALVRRDLALRRFQRHKATHPLVASAS